eukprot:gene16412-1281_t
MGLQAVGSNLEPQPAAWKRKIYAENRRDRPPPAPSAEEKGSSPQGARARWSGVAGVGGHDHPSAGRGGRDARCAVYFGYYGGPCEYTDIGTMCDPVETGDAATSPVPAMTAAETAELREEQEREEAKLAKERALLVKKRAALKEREEELDDREETLHEEQEALEVEEERLGVTRAVIAEEREKLRAKRAELVERQKGKEVENDRHTQREIASRLAEVARQEKAVDRRAAKADEAEREIEEQRDELRDGRATTAPDARTARPTFARPGVVQAAVVMARLAAAVCLLLLAGATAGAAPLLPYTEGDVTLWTIMLGQDSPSLNWCVKRENCAWYRKD